MRLTQSIRLLCAIFMLSTGFSVYAAWVGPQQVLSGGWGDGHTEFYVDWGDTPQYATLPILYDVASDGALVIADKRNGRVKVYGVDGGLTRNITPPVYRPKKWSMEPKFVGRNIVIPLDRYYFFDMSGELIAQTDGPGKVYFDGERDNSLFVAERAPNRRWLVYSEQGELTDTFTEKPLELGRVDEEIFAYQGDKLKRITVSFPDRQWTIAGEGGTCGEYNYFVDNAGFLHCIRGGGVLRYSACGKVIATHTVPESTYRETYVPPPGSGVEHGMEVVESYGDLVIADNGDLYASRYRQEGYSVVRWEWQDSPDDPVGGPDAPVNLTATVNDGEIRLDWTHSLQDPGCVTDYEVVRSSTEGGPYTALATTPTHDDVHEVYTYTDAAVESGSTYYYTVRAVSAIGKSDYSNEVSAELP